MAKALHEMFQAHDRRITNILLDYWNELRANRKFPPENQLDIDRLESIWESCFMVQVLDIEKIQDYNYTFLGSNIIEAYGQDLADVSEADIVSTQADHLSRKYKLVMDTESFAIDSGEFKNSKGKTVKYRQCLVPLGLGDNTQQVGVILGGMRYKLFD